MANVLTKAASAILGSLTGSHSSTVYFRPASDGSSVTGGGRQTETVDYISNGTIWQDLLQGMTPGDIYETQPHLHTVVDFVARNGAQLGRHIYKKAANGDRVRVDNSPAAKLLAKPNDRQTGYDLFNMLFSELAIYDMAIWVPLIRDGRWQIDPIPGSWITGYQKSDAFTVEKYRIQEPGSNSFYWLTAKDAIVFRGYSPQGFKHGAPALNSLRGIISEQISANQYRQQSWQRGGRVGMFMSRPATAPEWSPEAKAKFIASWKANFSGSGENAGSTPLLEDGMELKRLGFTAKEEQWLEAATLSLSTVAGAYHVPPAMVGVSGYNSFASVKEFRKMLYTETLGPGIAQVEDTINTFLLPFILEPAGNFLELNIGEKLQGDFEDQGAVIFQAVGGPYMTAAEARSKMNLPFLPGTDTLLAPLNMGAAGNNGPAADQPIQDSQNPPTDNTPPKSIHEPHGAHIDGGTRFIKAPIEPDYAVVADMSTEIKRVLKLQRADVRAKANLKTGDPEWWDQKRWNRELSSALLPHMTSLSAGVARAAAGAKGADPEAYSIGRTTNFLKSVADSRADLINATTRDQLKAAFDDGEDVGEAVDHVFDVAIETRAADSALTMSTMLTSWAAVEMANQLLSDKSPQKMWVSSGLPNSRHTDMNGETVGINEKFSNGADWPGDPVLGAEGVANCGCGVDIIT